MTVPEFIKVMLDRDLAELYGVETKRLKEQVRRNIERFPEDFMFELTKEEIKNLRSQFATSSWGGARYLPMALKEKQKAYVKSAKKKNKPSLDGSFTPKAKKIWEAIPGNIQIKILNNVWCVNCRKGSSMGNLIGKIESGMLVLRGTCTKCGGDVARVIENE